MRILGLSNMRDAAAALVENGQLLAAAEEERFVRIKHVSALPLHAVRFCLQSAGVRLQDLDAIAVPWKYWQLGRRAALAIANAAIPPALHRQRHACGRASDPRMEGTRFPAHLALAPRRWHQV